jgi:DNA-directed RNA polymerase subunit RPC12/RpoP
MGHRSFRSMFDFSRFSADAVIRCNGCGHDRKVKAAQLAQAFGPVPIAEAERRCKCTECGGRGARIVPVPA